MDGRERKPDVKFAAIALAAALLTLAVVLLVKRAGGPAPSPAAEIEALGDEEGPVRTLGDEIPMPEWRLRIEAARRAGDRSAVSPSSARTTAVSAAGGGTNAVPAAEGAARASTTPDRAAESKTGERGRAPAKLSASAVSVELADGNGTVTGELVADDGRTVVLQVRPGVRLEIPRRRIVRGPARLGPGL